MAPASHRRAEPVLGGTLQQVFGMAEGVLNYTRMGAPPEGTGVQGASNLENRQDNIRTCVAASPAPGHGGRTQELTTYS
ncbi:hypothetical protein [Streptomyces sp. NPDC048825]|uniref:hypothetical protein n=1 Tax=Streptomyces sp. NPDC048825 TaxID=3365592 RepID=UPI00371AC330